MTRIPRTATAAIVALTCAAWLITVLLGLDDRAAGGMGFIPARLSGLVSVAPAVPAILTPLTATLVHSGFTHLLFNMLLLGWCGSQVERVLGRGSLILLLVAGAYASAVAQYLAQPAGLMPFIGADGAVSAIVGAFAVSFSRARQATSSSRVNRWLNVAWLFVAWLVLQILLEFLSGGLAILPIALGNAAGFLAGLLLQRPLLMWRYRSA